MNAQEREDQGNVVDELTCIQKDGMLLKIRGMVLCGFQDVVCRFMSVYSTAWVSNAILSSLLM